MPSFTEFSKFLAGNKWESCNLFLKLCKAFHEKEANLCTVILIDKTLTVIIVYRTG
jgi:hypothetical protein